MISRHQLLKLKMSLPISSSNGWIRCHLWNDRQLQYSYCNEVNWTWKWQEHCDSNTKFGELLHHVKSLEQRLEDPEDQGNANSEDSAELRRAVGIYVDTADILENRLGLIESRVSSIKRLNIRSSKRKRWCIVRASQRTRRQKDKRGPERIGMLAVAKTSTPTVAKTALIK